MVSKLLLAQWHNEMRSKIKYEYEILSAGADLKSEIDVVTSDSVPVQHAHIFILKHTIGSNFLKPL